MAKDVRERMVAGATRLLATKGLQATSFSEVIELTATPRGSIYHHFPGGKDELVLAALHESGALLLATMEESRGKSADEVLDALLSFWRGVLESNACTLGCAVAAVTIGTEDQALLTAAGEVFAKWQERLTDLYAEGGLSRVAAKDFASHTLATIEGGVVMARAQTDLEPFDRAVRMLPRILGALKQA